MFGHKSALVLLLVVGAACSADAKGSKPAAAPGSAAPASTARTDAAPGACVLLTKADVDAAFAPRVFALEPEPQPDIAGTDRIASVSHCTYASRGASIREMITAGLLVRQAPTDAMGVTVATAKDGAVKLNGTPVDVPGLGDAAYWINLGSARRPIVQLNVFVGPRLWLVFSASDPTRSAEAAVADLGKVAETAIGRM